MNTILTHQDFIDLGFDYQMGKNALLPSNYNLVITDKILKSIITGSTYNEYKAIICSLCNDKNNGEYYIFIREGNGTVIRSKDSIVTITRDLLYKEDLIEFIRILNL